MPGHVVGGSPSRQRLGQHFLDSGLLASRIVADAGVGCEDRVVDFGAGTGVLTAALAERAGAVLAIEIDGPLAQRLARRFEGTPNVIVVHADVDDVPLPHTSYRVVANPPFARTAAILHRLLDDPAGGLVRADLVVQWQVARHRARVDRSPPIDLLGATWGPWWGFTRGRRLPATSFNPRPAVDAAVLEIKRRDPPLLPAQAFASYRAFVGSQFEARSDAPQVEVAEWVEQYQARGGERRSPKGPQRARRSGEPSRSRRSRPPS